MKVPLARFVKGKLSSVDLIERFNLQRVWSRLGLAALVGAVGGVGALAFQWLTQQAVRLFWNGVIGITPLTPGGEEYPFPSLGGPPWLWGLLFVPAIGGLLSGLLVYTFAPEAEGHGTDAVIRAYHRERGIVRPIIAPIKTLASAITIGSGGSAGREGPIAQIGAAFGSVLGGWLKLSDKERRILMAAGMGAGIGAIFRAPLAGALFSAEVLYSEPDIEPEVIIPALLSSITAYSIYCSVHGFGHLLTGTSSFQFTSPLQLPAYLVLGLVTAFGAVAFVTLFGMVTRLFRKWGVTNYLKPVVGGLLAGAVGVVAYLVTGGRADSLGVLGAGYGTLQEVVSIAGASPSLRFLAVVAFGKMLTTAFTIGSGGSGGVFGPSMVIGGALGAIVGTAFHAVMPEVVPNIGPFTIVGMAGFFAGAANTPLSTLLMVGDITGNYSLLIPAMLVVAVSLMIAHRWTLYPEQVRTRADSPAHRGEFLLDVLSDLYVRDVYSRDRDIATVERGTPLAEIVGIITRTTQTRFPVVDEEGSVVGIFSLNDVRSVLYEHSLRDLVVAEDLSNRPVFSVAPEDDVQRALQMLTLKNLDELPVIDSTSKKLLGMLSRRDIIAAYNTRILLATATEASPPAPRTRPRRGR